MTSSQTFESLYSAKFGRDGRFGCFCLFIFAPEKGVFVRMTEVRFSLAHVDLL